MNRMLAITLVWMLSAIQVYAQTISVDSFDLGETSVGMGRLFRVNVVNNQIHPIRYVRTTCSGTGSIETHWLRLDTTVINSERGLVVDFIIVPRTLSEISLRCALQFEDLSGNAMPPVEYSVTGLVTKAAILSVDSSTVDFGDVELGDTANAMIFLKNSGDGDASLYRWTQHSMVFGVDSLNYIVKAGDSLAVPVTFTPMETGEYSEEVVLGYLARDIEPPLAIHLNGRGVFSRSGLVPEYFDEPIGFYVSPPLTLTDSRSLKFTASSSDVKVVGIELRVGTAFSIQPQPLPIVVDSSHPLFVEVTWDPSGSGEIWTDTLDIRADNGKMVSVVLVGYKLTSVEDNAEGSCHPYPNPTNSDVKWCSNAFESWTITGLDGRGVNAISADADGNCQWTFATPGFYVMQSSASGKTMLVVVTR